MTLTLLFVDGAFELLESAAERFVFPLQPGDHLG
jgi:hypothetical protein